MHRHRRLMLSWALVPLIALGIAACGGSDTAESGGGGDGSVDLSIGAMVPLTGDLSDFGPSMEASSRIAVEQIRAAIDEAGLDHSVTLDTADTQGVAQAAVQAARALVAGGTNCLAGPAASSTTLPVARSVAIREDVPLVASVATSEEISELDDDGLVTRVMITDRYQGQALVDAMEEFTFEGSVDGKVAAVAARNDAYGTGVVKFFRDAWENAGGEIGTEILFDPEQANYNSEARRLTEGSPDVFLFVGFPEEYLRMGPALARTGDWSPEKTWGISLLSDDLPKEGGPEITEGLRDAGQGTPEDSEALSSFEDLYNQADTPPGQAFDSHQFDAVMLCYLAAAAAGSTEPDAMAEQLSAVSSPPGQKYSWQDLPQALEALANGEDIDYEGASGPINLDDNGDPTAGVFEIFTIRDGEHVRGGEVLVSGSEYSE